MSGGFSSALAGQVKLAWDTPTGYTNGTPVTTLAGYRLYVQDSTGGTQRVDVGKQTTYTLTGLTPGRTYAIAITALNTTSTGNESSKSNTIMVSVPRAQPDVATTPVGTSVTIAVLANDIDADGNTSTITAVTQGAHGTVTRQSTSVTYTPAATFVGTDSFTYTITDSQGASATATVTVTVLPDRAASLVAAYSFNEGSGTTVADASGHNNTGTVSGATWTTAGQFGRALVFNDTSAKVTIPDAPSLRLTTDMTLAAWVKPSTVTSAWRDVIYKGDDNYYLEATSPTSSQPAGGAGSVDRR